jgi:hypothetical protein
LLETAIFPLEQFDDDVKVASFTAAAIWRRFW